MVTPLKTLMGFSVHLNVQLKFYNLPYQKLVDNLTKLNLDNMAASIADYRQQVNDNQISFSEAL
ncbi:hypothetical protein LMB23_03650, partial [Limosilactobacillus reuteri]|nr:hypothetical protein [Limosilactobacillus reuteri]